MTPETRAARDRLLRYADVPTFPMPSMHLPPDVTHITADGARHMVDQIMRDVQATLAPDIRTVLEALDEHDEAPRDI